MPLYIWINHSGSLEYFHHIGHLMNYDLSIKAQSMCYVLQLAFQDCTRKTTYILLRVPEQLELIPKGKKVSQYLTIMFCLSHFQYCVLWEGRGVYSVDYLLVWKRPISSYFNRDKKAVLKCTWSAFGHSLVSFWSRFLPLSSASPIQSHWPSCSCSDMPSSLPPQSGQLNWLFSMPGLSLPCFLACFLLSFTQIYSHATLSEKNFPEDSIY